SHWPGSAPVVVRRDPLEQASIALGGGGPEVLSRSRVDLDQTQDLAFPAVPEDQRIGEVEKGGRALGPEDRDQDPDVGIERQFLSQPQSLRSFRLDYHRLCQQGYHIGLMPTGRFAYGNPPVICWGAGSIAELRAELDRLGCDRVALVTTRSVFENADLMGRLGDSLGTAGIEATAVVRQHAPESEVDDAVERVAGS